MIIYEKENKLNISFDNSTEAEPDVVISKEDGQVNIEAGGQPIGGDGGALVVHFEYDSSTDGYISDKTMKEIDDAAKIKPLIGVREHLDQTYSSPIIYLKQDVNVELRTPDFSNLFGGKVVIGTYEDDGTSWHNPD